VCKGAQGILLGPDPWIFRCVGHLKCGDVGRLQRDVNSKMGSLRIRIPRSGFTEVAKDADEAGTFDVAVKRILFLLQDAARQGDKNRTHLLTVSLHAFLAYKGGNYSVTHHHRQGGGTEALAPAAATD
jgi:hypothetical protein